MRALPLLLLALALRLLVPQGWMPAPGGGLMPCPAQMVMPAAAAPKHHRYHAGMKMPAHPDAATGHGQHGTMPDCPFAGLAAPAAPPAPPAIIMPRLRPWLPAPRLALPVRALPASPRFLRTPSQGPPLPAFA